MKKLKVKNKEIFFYFDDDDAFSKEIIAETFIENVYQLNDGQFNKRGVFIDIGANVGVVSTYVSLFNDHPHFRKVKVYAYEPQPENYECLLKNIKRNKQESRITPIAKAVYGEGGVWKINRAGGNSQISKKGDVEVEVITLADVFEENQITACDVLKIDVEGSEYSIINEASIETLQKTKTIVIEFGICDDFEVWGKFTMKLAEVFNLHIIGRPTGGGYIYGERY